MSKTAQSLRLHGLILFASADLGCLDNLRGECAHFYEYKICARTRPAHSLITNIRCKISGPAAHGRTSDADLKALYAGRGYKSYFVEGEDPEVIHQLLAAAMDDCHAAMRHPVSDVQGASRESNVHRQLIGIQLKSRWRRTIVNGYR